jgi:hypothetical protein
LDFLSLAIAGNYWGWVIIDKEFWADPPDLNTEAGKAAAFDAINARAGTYACDGRGNWSWNQTFSIDPTSAKVPIHTAIEIDDPETRWWFFDADGERIQPGGRAVKVE